MNHARIVLEMRRAAPAKCENPQCEGGCRECALLVRVAEETRARLQAEAALALRETQIEEVRKLVELWRKQAMPDGESYAFASTASYDDCADDIDAALSAVAAVP